MLNNQELISIIVPVYNGEKYLPECLDSILNQSYKNLEVIIVNDGSVDSTQNICDEYQKKDSRIVVYNNSNHGVSYSRNFGIKKSNGKYVGFVDSDDLIDVKMYEQLVSAFNHDVQLSACNVKFLYSRKNKLSCKQTDNLIIYSKDDMYKEILNNKNLSGYAANKLYKKEIINLMKKNELFNENIYICEDILFNCNYLKYCTNIAYINNQYYMYYINSSGAYNQKFNNKWLTSIDAYDEMLDIYKNHSEQNLIYAYCNYIEANFEILKKIKLAELKDKKLKKIYKNNINKYFKCVLFSKKISLKKKIKIILYKIDPTLIYKIKNVLKK